MSESAISVEEYQLDNVATLAKLHGLYSPPPDQHNKPSEQYSKYIQQLNRIVKFQQEDESTCKKRRKTWIIRRIELEKDHLYGIWEDLSEEEKNDKDIIYCLLEHTRNIFGTDPWVTVPSRRDSYHYKPPPATLPDAFQNDPNAFIAFTRHDEFNPITRDTVPSQFRDNDDVMVAASNRTPSCFTRFASPRLKDSEEIIRKIIFGNKDVQVINENIWIMSEVSQRLRDDFNFVASILKQYCAQDFNKNSWTHMTLQWLGRMCMKCSNSDSHDDDDDDEIKEARYSLEQLRSLVGIIPAQEVPRLFKNSHIERSLYRMLSEDKDIMLRALNESGSNSLTDELFRLCSEELKSNNDIQTVVKQKMGQIYIDNWKRDVQEHQMTQAILNDITTYVKSSLDKIPVNRKLDPDVIDAAKLIIHDVDSFYAYIQDIPCEEEIQGYEKKINYFYEALPKKLHSDEEVGKIFILKLKCEHHLGSTIVKNIPELAKSKEVMIQMLETVYDSSDPANFLEICPAFYDDYEFMSLAVEKVPENIQYASQRLRDSRPFMKIASESSPVCIVHMTSEFQLNNLDLIENAIDKAVDWYYDSTSYLEGLDENVWYNRPIVLKWVSCKSTRNDDPPGEILEFLYYLGEEGQHPFLSDREIMKAALLHTPSAIDYVSKTLKEDKDFLLDVVRETGKRIIDFELVKLAYSLPSDSDAVETEAPDELLVASLANNPASLLDCFKLPTVGANDLRFEYLIKLSIRVRTSLLLHESFMLLLTGIARTNQNQVHPSRRCYLPMLDQGMETSVDLKQEIASYIGVIFGSEYEEYKKALLALEQFGL